MISRRTIPFLICVTLFVGALIFNYLNNKKGEEALRNIKRKAANPADVKTDRLEQARSLQYKEPGKALEVLEAIIAKPSKPEEKVAALDLAPSVMAILFTQHVKEGQMDLAQKLSERLNQEFPKAPATRDVAKTWGREIGKKLLAAIEAQKPEEVEKLFLEYRSGQSFLPLRTNAGDIVAGEADYLAVYAQFQLSRWLKLGKSERQSEPGIRLASEWASILLDHNAAFKLCQRIIESDVPASEMWALGWTLEQRGNLPAAFTCLTAVRAAFQSGTYWPPELRGKVDRTKSSQAEQQIDKRFADVAVRVADSIATDAVKPLCTMSANGFLENALKQSPLPEAMAVISKARLRLAIDAFLAETESMPPPSLAALALGELEYDKLKEITEFLYRTVRQCNEIDNTLSRSYFEALMRAPGAEIWEKVPAPIRTEIEAALPLGIPAESREENRRQQLKTMIEERRIAYPIDIPLDYQKRRCAVLAQKAAQGIFNSTEESMRTLRLVVNDPAYSDGRSGVQEAIQKSIRQSAKVEDFDVFVSCVAFYASEFATASGDAFREELRALLTSSAERFAKTAPMRHVFAHALLANFFPTDAKGIESKGIAIKAAFASVAGTTPEVSQAKVTILSDVTGYSCLAVKNETEHHILLAYDGPEQVLILCAPLRKGSILLKNGKYKIAVMTPLGNIRPYHAVSTLKDQQWREEYAVAGTGMTPWNQPQVGRDYVLLRTGNDLPKIALDPRTGFVKRQ